jgi:hypothetical protein
MAAVRSRTLPLQHHQVANLHRALLGVVVNSTDVPAGRAWLFEDHAFLVAVLNDLQVRGAARPCHLPYRRALTHKHTHIQWSLQADDVGAAYLAVVAVCNLLIGSETATLYPGPVDVDAPDALWNTVAAGAYPALSGEQMGKDFRALVHRATLRVLALSPVALYVPCTGCLLLHRRSWGRRWGCRVGLSMPVAYEALGNFVAMASHASLFARAVGAFTLAHAAYDEGPSASACRRSPSVRLGRCADVAQTQTQDHCSSSPTY